ncbi:MAG TPA: peptide chain release factor N(5)-glutamine methyltransferase [Solirubrobacterales bacterium]|nr:peptide chain release factor N(5)-glutamine methyltransferase [Solirubrobacterales bacterium]
MSASTAAGLVREALAAATDALAAAGVETPRLDAQLLLAEATGRERAELAAHPEGGVEPTEARMFGGMVRRRVRREPVAYIIGRKGFRGIELAVDPRVLIPRPETELLVELARELRPPTVLDVGTGSGAVALAVADEFPQVRVTATDVSEPALQVARGNAARLGLSNRVRFLSGSHRDGGHYALTLANLPYVSDDEWRLLEPEITAYEPREALVAGPTGLEAIEALISTVGRGVLALEVGAGQAPGVTSLMREAGFDALETRRDLAGIERVVVGRR